MEGRRCREFTWRDTAVSRAVGEGDGLWRLHKIVEVKSEILKFEKLATMGDMPGLKVLSW